ncbi:MAG: recombination regulator RecX [Comamonadaceae bacterium]|nr:MAG: recombination regulator RecX [Comamonadaceae bacterium]
MAFSAPSLKGRALRLLSQREHSRAELERKLRKYEEEPGTLAAALDDLAAKDFISEARVVQSVLHQRAPRLGALRVRQELQHKGIAPAAVAEAVAGLNDSEYDRALALWRRRFDAPPADARERARQSRFLLQRGFAGSTVGKVLKTDFDDAE